MSITDIAKSLFIGVQVSFLQIWSFRNPIILNICDVFLQIS